MCRQGPPISTKEHGQAEKAEEKCLS